MEREWVKETKMNMKNGKKKEKKTDIENQFLINGFFGLSKKNSIRIWLRHIAMMMMMMMVMQAGSVTKRKYNMHK